MQYTIKRQLRQNESYILSYDNIYDLQEEKKIYLISEGGEILCNCHVNYFR
jgi:hypothetical protein